MNGQRPLFFYHAGCCRHAAHGVGDGGDDKEENSFSDWRRHHHQKGEADNSRHGFLCLYHPNYVLLQVTPAANRNTPDGLMTVWGNAAEHFFDDYARNIR